MLARVEQEDGSHLLLDPTSREVASGFDAGYRGLSYLPLTEDGAPLEEFPDPAEGDTLLIRFTGSLDPAASLIRGEIEILPAGSADQLYRSMLRRTPADRHGILLEVLTGAVTGSVEWILPDISDASLPLEIRGSGLWDVHSLKLTDGTTAVPLPGLMELSLAGTRMAALLLPEDICPGGVRISTPMSEVLEMRLEVRGSAEQTEHREGVWTRTVSMPAADTLEVREECILLPVRSSRGILEDMLNGLEARCQDWRRVVVLE